MHELSITRNIVRTVSEHACGRTITGVTIRVGALSGVDVQAVRFCFDACTQGTVLEGATLYVEEIPARARCHGCNEAIEIEGPLALCPCERRARLTIEAGDELLIQSMEVS